MKRAIAEYNQDSQKAPDDPELAFEIGQAMFNIGAPHNNDKAKYQELDYCSDMWTKSRKPS